MMIPHALGTAATDALTTTLLTEAEGVVTRPYLDETGHPTIGIGFNLQVPALFDLVLGALGIKRSAATAGAVAGMEATIAAPPSSTARLDATLDGLVHQLHAAGQASADSFTLTEAQAGSLLPQVIAALGVDATVAAHAAGSGLDQGSAEWAVLRSLDYNGGSGLLGPHLTADLAAGDRAEAWYEIRYRSNAAQSQGIETRRVAESDLFGLTDPGPVSRTEAASVFAMVLGHAATLFRNGHPTSIDPDSCVDAAATSFAGAFAQAQGRAPRTLLEDLAPAARALLRGPSGTFGSDGQIVTLGAESAGTKVDLAGGGTAQAVFVKPGAAGAAVQLGPGLEVAVVAASCSLALAPGAGSVADLILRAGSSTLDCTAGSRPAGDTLAIGGHSIAEALHLGPGASALDSAGRSIAYDAAHASVTIDAGRASVTLTHFVNGAFGLTFV